MWVAGLRGAMAYALALESITEMPEAGRVMLLVTLIYSLFTILGISSVLYPIMTYCQVTGASKKPDQGQVRNESWEEVDSVDVHE